MFLPHRWDYFCLSGRTIFTSQVGLFCLRGKALLLSLPSSELFQLTSKATDDIRSFVLLILLNILVRYTSSVAEKGYKVS
jgi:hypothetical protein